MKKITLIFSLLLLLSSSYGQQTKEDLEKKITEQKTEIESQKVAIQKLTTENNYYREALKLINSTVVSTFKDEKQGFEFKVNSVLGNKVDKTITINGIYTNHTDAETIQAQIAQLVDPSGNQYQTYNIKLSPNGTMAERVPTDVPMKFSVTFEKVEYTPDITYFSIAVFGQTLRSPKVEFKSLKIDWKQ